MEAGVTSDWPAALNQLMRALLLVALLALTAACGAYQFPGSPSPSPATATVSGRVLSVPCAPVEKAGTTCAGRPVPNLEIDYFQGDIVARAVTDASGNYSVQLEPGTFTVKLKTFMRVINGPTTLAVSAGSSVVANYTLDSGIRAPVPQQ